MEDLMEIEALMHLLDDPDDGVYDAVESRVLSYGKRIIPNLEHLWETSPEAALQARIESIIHRLQFNDLKEDFRAWATGGQQDLLVGALLVARFHYPDLSSAPVLLEIERLRRSIWLEINASLTPLEQIRIVTGILYGYYGLKGGNTEYNAPNPFLINQVIESKRGNQLSNGILYMILCELLHIPVRALSIPKQFVLAYFRADYGAVLTDAYQEKIMLYIDPTTGQVFAQKDLDAYFKRIAVPPVAAYYRQLSHIRIVQHLLEELIQCYDEESEGYKRTELAELAVLLEAPGYV